MIHPLADVQTKNIGERTNVWQFCVILKNAIIGIDCNINCNVFIEDDVIIGDRVTVKSGVQLWNGITVEDDVFIGPNVTFTNNPAPRSKQHLAVDGKTLIKKGASIGANATILPGVIIGSYAFVGAGSVVTKEVAPYTVWYGNPARHNGYITPDGILLDKHMVAKNGDKYLFEDGLLKKK